MSSMFSRLLEHSSIMSFPFGKPPSKLSTEGASPVGISIRKTSPTTVVTTDEPMRAMEIKLNLTCPTCGTKSTTFLYTPDTNGDLEPVKVCRVCKADFEKRERKIRRQTTLTSFPSLLQSSTEEEGTSSEESDRSPINESSYGSPKSVYGSLSRTFGARFRIFKMGQEGANDFSDTSSVVSHGSVPSIVAVKSLNMDLE